MKWNLFCGRKKSVSLERGCTVWASISKAFGSLLVQQSRRHSGESRGRMEAEARSRQPSKRERLSSSTFRQSKVEGCYVHTPRSIRRTINQKETTFATRKKKGRRGIGVVELDFKSKSRRRRS